MLDVRYLYLHFSNPATGQGRTFPIPHLVPAAGGQPRRVEIVFLYYPEPPGMCMSPTEKRHFDPTNGSLLFMQPVHDSSVRAGVLGGCLLPEGMSPSEYTTRRDEAFAAMDGLIQDFLAGRPFNADSARTVLDFYRKATEPQLWPVYRREGRAFFEALEHAASP